MDDRRPRPADDQALYDKILAEIKSEGMVPERNWQVVAKKRFEHALVRKARHERANPLREDLRACGVEVEPSWELSEKASLAKPGVLLPTHVRPDLYRLTEDDLRKPGVLQTLLEHVNGGYDDETLHAILSAIHRMPDYGAETANVTRVMLDRFTAIHGRSQAKFDIGNLLAETAEKSDLDKLREILDDKSHGVSRWGIVTAVARLMKADAIPLLIDLLKDETVRVSAIENLGRLNASEAIPYVEPFSNDKDAYVRQIARKAIRQCKPKASKRSRLPPPSTIESIGDHPYEASINFDLEDLGPCLRRMNKALKLGLPALALVQLAEELETEEERGFTFRVPGDSGKVDLHLRIYKDDVDACSLFVFTPSESLAASVERLMLS